MKEHDIRKAFTWIFVLLGLFFIVQMVSFYFFYAQDQQMKVMRTELISQFNTTLEQYNSFDQQREQKSLEDYDLKNQQAQRTLFLKYDAQNQQKFDQINSALTTQQVSLKSYQEDIASLKSASGDFSSIIEQAIQGVVAVKTDVSLGSGFFVTQDGYIVTNNHVIDGASYAIIQTYDRMQYRAQLVGYDATYDIALLKINGTFNPITLADSDSLQIGRKVVAIGNPLGLSFSVSEGIISATHRQGANGLNVYIQTDVSLNPGNSGGPLIDTSGNAIGVNNFIISNAQNLGFALESNSVKSVVNRLAKKNII